MLGKLIKYEFKHTSKTMMTTYAALAVATLMGSIALTRTGQNIDSVDTFFDVLGMVMLVLYIIAIIGIYCIDFIYLCYHYNKTMYSSQGYLTHTLPVSPTATFGAKILVFFIWMFISSLLSVLSMMVLLQVGTGGEFFRALSDINWGELDRNIHDLFGMSAGSLLFVFFAESILGILLYILWITASMAIGQLFHKNRTVSGILAALCLYVINQVVSSLYLAASGYSTATFLNGDLSDFINLMITGSIAMSAVFVVVLCVICIYINRKKLNLE